MNDKAVAIVQGVLLGGGVVFTLIGLLCFGTFVYDHINVCVR